VVNANATNNMQNAKEILDKVNSVKMNAKTLKNEKTKGIISGTFIGMGGGLLLGMARNYNLVNSAIVGALFGALITQLLLPKNDDNEDE
jgi:uncharacterized membrane protein